MPARQERLAPLQLSPVYEQWREERTLGAGQGHGPGCVLSYPGQLPLVAPVTLEHGFPGSPATPSGGR